MSTRLPHIFFVTLLNAFIIITPLHADAGTRLVLSDTSGRPHQGVSSTAVFLSDTERIYVHAELSVDDKVNVEFSWYRPDGKPFSRMKKIAFPSSGGKTGYAADSISPGGMAGWWRVDVAVAGAVYTRLFLVTDNRATLAVGAGERWDRLAALESLAAGDEGLDDILRLAAQDDDQAVRAAGVAAAGRIGGESSAGYILAAASDPSETVRSMSAYAAVMLGGETARTVLERLVSDEAIAVREDVAEALKEMETGYASGLLARLVADPYYTVREAALYTLSGLEGDGVIAALSEGFSVDDPEFRKDVLDVMLKKDGAGRDAAIAGLLSDPFPDVRYAAFDELMLSGGDWPVEKARPLVDDADEQTALAAFRFLSGHGDSGVVGPALKSMHSSVRLAALEYVQNGSVEQAAGWLTMMVRDEDISIRSRALDGLTELGEAGVSGLLVALEDPDPSLRRRAALSLAATAAPDAADGMLKAAKDSDPAVRALAIDYLSRRSVPEAIEVLEDAVSDPDAAVRRAGLKALVDIKDERSSVALGSYYYTGDFDTRYAVVDELAGRDDRFALEVLAGALDDPDAAIRMMAVSALSERGRAQDVARLALDPDQDVRRAALEAIRSGPEPEMVDVLGKSLDDPDPGVRLQAIEALSLIDGPRAGEAVSSALRDGSKEVRGLAARLLLERTDNGSVAGLVALLGEADLELRRSAAAHLSELESGRVDDMVYAAVSTGEVYARELALDVLKRRKSGLLPSAVIRGIGDRDGRVREAALGIVPSLDQDARKAAYLAALASADSKTRIAGVRGLKGMGGSDVVDSLLHALYDEAALVRLGSVERLKELDAPELGVHLPGLVVDSDRKVAGAALDALRPVDAPCDRTGALVIAALGAHTDLARDAVDLLIDTGDPRALFVLEEYFKAGYRQGDILSAAAAMPGDRVSQGIGNMYRASRRDEPMRMTAVRALAGRGPAALETLREALSDPSIDVRVAAVKSISSLDPATPGRLDALGLAVKSFETRVSSTGLDALSGTDDPHAAVFMLPAIDSEEYRDKALAGIDRLAAPGVLPELAENIGVVQDNAARAGLVRMLAEKGLDAASMGGLLKDPDREVRAEALSALLARGVEGVYELLIAGSTSDASVRGQAAESVAEADPSLLRKALDAQFERGTANAGVLALASQAVSDASLLKWLAGRLPDDDTARLRAVLGPVMARGDTGGVPVVLEGLKTSDRPLRAELLGWLASLGPGDAEDALNQALTSYPEYGSDIIDTASGSGYSAGIALAALVHGDPVISAKAMRALAGLACGSAETAMLAGLDDPDTGVRLAAAEAAGESGCVAALGKAAGDSSAGVRTAAVSGLAGVYSPAVLDAVVRLSLDDSEDVSSAALETLSGFGDDVPDGVWVEFTGSDRPKAVRLAALEALASRADPGHAPLFAGAMKDNATDVSAAGEAGLTALGKAALPVLHPLLRDARARAGTIRVLSGIADPSSEAALVELLASLDAAGAEEVVEALGRLGGKDSLKAFAAMYDRSDLRIKVAVLKALTGLSLSGNEPELVRLLSEAVGEPDESARFYAARAVGELKVNMLEERLRSRIGKEASPLVLDAMKRSLDKLGD